MAGDSFESREVVVKAISVGGEVQPQSSIGGGDDKYQAFTSLGALDPPCDFAFLCKTFEHSNCLRSNVDAYATNIDGFGFRLEPVLNFDATDIKEHVRQIMLIERERRNVSVLDDAAAAAALVVTDEEVTLRIEEYRRQAMNEKIRLQDFFDACCFDYSFVKLRKITRQDLEVTGNAYWEVLRDARGDVARFVYLPADSVRLMPIDQEETVVEEPIRVARVILDKVTTRRRLRRFVQIVNGLAATYFKSYGDNRVISRRTGKAYPSFEYLRSEEPNSQQATEIIHFSIHSPHSPYGVPRWIGNLISALGSRSMEEVNYLYFDNKSVPPLALLVSGGHLSQDSVPRIESFIEDNLKGKTNFHKILVLEAEGSSGSGQQVKIELRPLTDAQQKDELFQQYDSRNIDKIGSSFRLPPLIRGDGRNFNRSVADAQLRFAEDQVFQPERDDFDFMMNRRILLAMGVRFWKFQSQTIVVRDPERMTDIVAKLTEKGVLTPAEARECAGDILNRELKTINDDWTLRPITLTLAGIQTGVQDLKDKTGASPLGTAVKQLKALRDELDREAQELSERRMELARKYAGSSDDNVEHIKVPAKEFNAWFEATNGELDAG